MCLRQASAARPRSGAGGDRGLARAGVELDGIRLIQRSGGGSPLPFGLRHAHFSEASSRAPFVQIGASLFAW